MNINFLKPWEFSRIILIYYISFIFKNKLKINIIIILFILYVIIHTKIDFFSQHVIFINKIQKISLNHIIPFILNIFLKKNKNKLNKFIYFNKFIKNLIYLNLINIFLNKISIIKFYNMLNKHIYIIINILELLFYIIYWFLIFNLKIKNSIKKNILFININILNKILLGSYIYFNNKEIYSIYKICGRINKITVLKDQQISGMILWIINSMMLLLNIYIL